MKKHFKNWNIKLSGIDYVMIFLVGLMLSYSTISYLFFNKPFNTALFIMSLVLSMNVRNRLNQSITK